MNDYNIKVGSEWVFEDGITLTVIHATEKFVLYKWEGEGEGDVEGVRTVVQFLRQFKPKPVERVVWMNVYNGYVLTYPTKKMADSAACSSRLFCQRVVIKEDVDE